MQPTLQIFEQLAMYVATSELSITIVSEGDCYYS